MLRRNSSRSQQPRPLGRSKSTNSIVRNPVHELGTIDPRIAERDAHIAATLSYNRALRGTCPDAGDMTRSSTRASLTRCDSTISRQHISRSDSVISRSEHPQGTNDPGALRRQQSVRFTGPGAKPRRALGARANMDKTPAPAASTSTSPRGRPWRASYSNASGGRNDDTQSVANSITDTLTPFDKTHLPERSFASLQSSYKKIRKSRSMFTSSSTAATDYHFSSSPVIQQPKKYFQRSRFAAFNKENLPVAHDAPSLRVPKLTNPSRDRTHLSERPNNDLAVQLAREKFFEDVGQQNRLKSQPSLFFRSKFKRSDSSVGFHRSIRQTSNNSSAISSAFSNQSSSAAKTKGLRKTARRVSKSLRSKFKGIFGRQTSSGLSADHHEDDNQFEGFDGQSCIGPDQMEQPEDASVSRVTSHLPSLHVVPSNQQVRSREGSLESLTAVDQQAADDRSRVTSWTDSTTNTVENSHACGEWERQRLSVIKENGAHVSSSSLNRMPRESEQPVSQDTTAQSYPVDSQRIYAALMSRLEDTKIREEKLRKKSIDNIRSYGLAPSRNTSINQLEDRPWSPPTIRYIQTEDDVFHDRDANESRREWSESADSVVWHRRISGNQDNQGTDGHDNREPKTVPVHPPGDKPEQSQTFGIPRSVSQRSSAFFASPERHLFRTASPYRRALQENMKATQVRQGAESFLSPATRHLNSLSEIVLPTRRPTPAGTELDQRLTASESVYSFSTALGRTPGNESTAAQDHELPKTNSHGNVTIFVNSPSSTAERPTRREMSSAGSVEWKTWLSANVAKLEGEDLSASSPKNLDYGLLEKPKSGHKREEAEIESPGEPWRLDMDETLPVLDGQRVAPTPNSPRSILGRSDTHSVPSTQRLPGGDIETKFAGPQSLRPPAIPARNNLRTTPSLPCVRSTNNENAQPLSRMRSLNTLGKSSPFSKESLQKRRSRGRVLEASPSALSRPGLTVAIQKQFGRTATESPTLTPQHHGRFGYYTPRLNASQGSLGAGAGSTSEIDAQVMGSKTMVDLFLSSRRRRIQGSGTRTASDSSPAAFI